MPRDHSAFGGQVRGHVHLGAAQLAHGARQTHGLLKNRLGLIFLPKGGPEVAWGRLQSEPGVDLARFLRRASHVTERCALVTGSSDLRQNLFLGRCSPPGNPPACDLDALHNCQNLPTVRSACVHSMHSPLVIQGATITTSMPLPQPEGKPDLTILATQPAFG